KITQDDNTSYNNDIENISNTANNRGLKVHLNSNRNASIGTSSQSSLSTSALPTDVLDEYDSDTSEFPSDFKQTTDMLIQLKERILDSSKKMLSPSIESSNKSINRKPSSIYSEGSSSNNLSNSYTGKPYVPTIRYTTSFPNKSYTDLNNSNNNLNNSYTYHNNVSQDSIANNDSLSKYRKIFEYTEDEIRLFNTIEEYALLPKGRLNPGLDDSFGESDEINKLKDEQVMIYKKLNSTRTVLHKEMLAHVNCLNEKEELEKRVQELQSLLEEKENIIKELKVEVETEKESADLLRKEKQTVQDEKRINWVADEARKRHKAEKINKIITGKLKDSQFQLETQNQQLNELRKKMEEINFENITNKKMMEENKRMSILSGISDEEQFTYDVNSIDTFLLAEFKDFISSAFNVKMSKLHSIPYMKNCLEDDIMPCLRFGSDPKISWKRLTEEIASNSLLLQEISPNSGLSSPRINRAERSSSISVGNLSNSSNSTNNSIQNNRSSMWARLSVQAGFGSGIIYDQLTQSTTTYKRSLSISQIKSEYGGSNSSIIGTIQSPITHSNTVVSYPLNNGDSNDSSNSSITQDSDQVKPNHRVLNLDTYKPPTSKRNSYLPSTMPNSEYIVNDNGDHNSSVATR
ncbi:hypothetical protein LY90DRAFT_708171, partial [Neocallimastix californiae]